ncbi:hypothetical protein LVJ94_30600 [Pendulispora rubella]|uniref:Uncharacterized protein n=1 Tax=Pendulispora rubella TaxID=2741070 RepID=A0ABZ2KY67_9BACT
MRNKTEILGELRTMLRDIFTAKAAGETNSRLARAHGYVDGYMRALQESDIATRSELVEIVNAERERASGPAMIFRQPVSDVAPAPGEASSDDRTAAA